MGITLCLQIQCPIHLNLLSQDQPRLCSFVNVVFDSFSCKSDVISSLLVETLAAEVLTCKTAVPESFLFKEQILCVNLKPCVRLITLGTSYFGALCRTSGPWRMVALSW